MVNGVVQQGAAEGFLHPPEEALLLGGAGVEVRVGPGKPHPDLLEELVWGQAHGEPLPGRLPSGV